MLLQGYYLYSDHMTCYDVMLSAMCQFKVTIAKRVGISYCYKSIEQHCNLYQINVYQNLVLNLINYIAG